MLLEHCQIAFILIKSFSAFCSQWDTLSGILEHTYNLKRNNLQNKNVNNIKQLILFLQFYKKIHVRGNKILFSCFHCFVVFFDTSCLFMSEIKIFE